MWWLSELDIGVVVMPLLCACVDSVDGTGGRWVGRRRG